MVPYLIIDEYGMKSYGVETAHGIERYCNACGGKIDTLGNNWTCYHEVFVDETTGKPVGQKTPTRYYHLSCAPIAMKEEYYESRKGI